MTLKLCRECELPKEECEYGKFTKSKTGKTYVQSICKLCLAKREQLRRSTPEGFAKCKAASKRWSQSLAGKKSIQKSNARPSRKIAQKLRNMKPETREYQKQWKLQNPGARSKWNKTRRKIPKHQLHDLCMTRIKGFLKGKNKKKKASTETLIGCTFEHLTSHLGLPQRGTHIDHIFPLKLYEEINLHTLKRAFNYKNLQRLTAMENLSKSATLPTKAMASKVPKELWPEGITEADLPDIYPGWSTPLRM